jgi:carbamoyl-phosphate synthase large subunit
MRHFTGIRVWHPAHALAKAVYDVTARFPAAHRYGITTQLQRAALSVPANITEGAKRESAAEFARFLNIAEASLAEVQYLLLMSREMALGPADRIAELEADAAMLARRLHALKVVVRRQAA